MSVFCMNQGFSYRRDIFQRLIFALITNFSFKKFQLQLIQNRLKKLPDKKTYSMFVDSNTKITLDTLDKFKKKIEDLEFIIESQTTA